MAHHNHHRIITALALSIVAHMLFLAAYGRMADWYRQQDLRPTRYLPDLLLLAPDLFRQRNIGRIPERLMQRVEATTEPGAAVAMPTFDVAPPALASVEPVPADDTLPTPGERQPIFLSQPSLADFSLNERDIEAVAQLRDQYDAYARYWSPDVDPGDTESASRTKAEAIVARAFTAMGGLDKLLKITEIRTVVWVEAFETASGEGRQQQIDTVRVYPYPIATWRMHDLNKFDRDAFRVAFDLSSGKPFPAYVTKNPVFARRAYYELFDARWHLFAPVASRKLRLASERARWHICDWFLGEGIRLSYAGAGRLGGESLLNPAVDRVYVDDRKYGRQFEAYFDRGSGLLLAMRETLDEAEASWFQQQRGSLSAPTWLTHYDDYRQVGDVLLPHQWTRSMSMSRNDPRRPLQRVLLHLNIAINGAAPDTVAPEL